MCNILLLFIFIDKIKFDEVIGKQKPKTRRDTPTD